MPYRKSAAQLRARQDRFPREPLCTLVAVCAVAVAVAAAALLADVSLNQIHPAGILEPSGVDKTPPQATGYRLHSAGYRPRVAVLAPERRADIFGHTAELERTSADVFVRFLKSKLFLTCAGKWRL
ncbi:hypothetical protein RRG08_049078 [Elysia crispata]|uniref:Uncharacterized protein n=1 Tax=Elysia crispata TaxID=231223 RepID=A0AAE1DWB9_9GAST|nr:hypothetical protein RRG08_049078 [Elysia crispata]